MLTINTFEEVCPRCKEKCSIAPHEAGDFYSNQGDALCPNCFVKFNNNGEVTRKFDMVKDKVCEVCGREAKWDCQHISGRTTYRCNKHSGVTKTTTGYERKLHK